MKKRIILSLVVTLTTAGCYSFTARHQHVYADYAAVYVARSLDAEQTIAALKAHLTRDDLNVYTPQGTCRIRPAGAFREVSQETALQDVAETNRFFSSPKHTSGGSMAKAYSFEYYSLDQDLYTSALPQNLLYGCSWGMSGSPRTKVCSRAPRLFRAFVFCDQKDNIVFWSIEKPYESWRGNDTIRTDFEEGKLKGWSPNQQIHPIAGKPGSG